MKRIVITALLGLLASCSNTGTWEDMKSAGRYTHHAIDSLFGRDHESRFVASNDDFFGPGDEEFLPLNDEDLKKSSDAAVAQPFRSLGDGVPGLERFQSPSGELAGIFRQVHFDTDDHIMHNKDDLLTITKMATYMKKHPQVYLVIEGHCDERASATYNLALGSRRANHIRSLLIKQGVDSQRIYSISHGRERPVASGHTPDQWALNRRGEFKIYTQ